MEDQQYSVVVNFLKDRRAHRENELSKEKKTLAKLESSVFSRFYKRKIAHLRESVSALEEEVLPGYKTAIIEFERGNLLPAESVIRKAVSSDNYHGFLRFGFYPPNSWGIRGKEALSAIQDIIYAEECRVF